MKAWASLGLLLLLCVSAQASEVEDSDEYEEPSDMPHIIAHKVTRAKLESGLHFPIVIQGRNVTIDVTLYNAGSSTAKNVIISDILPPNAQLLDGSLTSTWPKLSSGSEVKHTYTIVFTSGGSTELTFLPPGAITFTSDSGSELSGHTTRCGVFLLSPVQQITRWALRMGVFASLGICKTPTHWRNMAIFLGLIGVLVGVQVGTKQFGATRTNTRRRKALQELEKEGNGKDK